MGWLTIPEYTTEPTSVNVTDLVAGGAQAAQTAELLRKLNRATAWCDNVVSQPLQAAVRTETKRVPIGRDGIVPLHPGPWPLIALTAVSIGTTASNLVALADLTPAWVEDDTFMMPITGTSFSSVPIQFGAPRIGRAVLVRYSYTSGFPHSELRASSAPGATALTLASTVGMTVGQSITIVDGPSSETTVVTGITSATVVAVTALANAHTYVAGAATAIAVHAFPEDLKQAATLASSALIKARGNDSIVMSQMLTPATNAGTDPVASADLRTARSILLGTYGRVA